MKRLASLAIFLAIASCASFPAGRNPTVRVACVGDSITEGAGAAPGNSYPSQLGKLLGPGWKVANFGSSACTVLKKGDFPYWEAPAFGKALKSRSDIYVIMLGTNDTRPRNRPFRAEFHADYSDLVRTFQALPEHPQVFVCQPPPIPEPGNYGLNESALQQEIRTIDRVARETGASVIDTHASLIDHPTVLVDRVHPNDEGAAIIAATVAGAIRSAPGSGTGARL